MKSIFTILFILGVVNTQAQVICGTANEGEVVTLTAPAGYVFTSIEFASYGTPSGSCGSFVIGTCHAANSVSIAEAVFLNMNSASLSATNGVFGDPCGGTVKRLYIAAAYSLALPLKLVSFTAQKTGAAQITLDWSSDNEINTSHFIIEKSTDGALFKQEGNVTAHGTGENEYQYTTGMMDNIPVYFYRLQMVDQDGRFQYSNILRVSNNDAGKVFAVFPNPVTEHLTITSTKKQQAIITNATGQVITKILLINGSQTINMKSWKSGMYFIRTEDGIKEILKQ